MQVLFTETAENCLKEIESFAIDNYPLGEIAAFVDGLVERNYAAIAQQPTLYRYNRTLLNFAVKFQERLDSSYRCLYEVKDDVAYVMLILHTKQDLVSALYRHQIIRNIN
ncbi:MAG: toxin ParE1/3/4 [Paraglaciecola sp.]